MLAAVTAPLLAADSPLLLYRAFFSVPDSVKGADGRPINAVLGATNALLWAIEQHGPRAVAPCFGEEDAKYRKQAYPPYHAARESMPDDLWPQFELAAELWSALGWAPLLSTELEADDLMGSLARLETDAGGKTLILTGDRDMFQCVNEHVQILLTRPRAEPELVDPAGVRERYGIDPEQVPDFIALRGDPSDGLPGAKGIGAKTAADILRRHGTLEAAIAGAVREKPSVRRALLEQTEELRTFRDVATLRDAGVERPADATPTSSPGPPLPTGWVWGDCRSVFRRSAGKSSPMRNGAALVLITLVGVLAPAGTSAWAEPLPATTPLSSGWEFHRDAHNQGLALGWSRGDLATDWEDITVPHVFDAVATDNLFGGTIGWYRIQFTGPATPAGWGWRVRFDSARRVARAWLNGSELGTTSDPYVPTTLPLRGLRPGAPNELVVRVQNLRERTLREGWWNWGGLVRGVSLVPQPPVVLEDAAVLPDVRCGGGRCKAAVTLDGWLVNRGSRRAAPRVDLLLSKPGGAPAASAATRVPSLAPGERRRVRRRVAVANPSLWRPGSPYLYDATIRLSSGGRLLDTQARRVGLRSVKVDSSGHLRLNGYRLALRGAAVQEDLPGRGPALRPEDVEQIVADLKGVNATVTRAHYLLNERLLQRLDEEGILVWSQAPIYHADRELRDGPGRARALASVRATVLAARNHPSVLTHSVANELAPEPDDVDGTRAFLRDAAALVRDLDASVPAALDLLSYPSIPRQDAYDDFPLLGINSYYGWYKGKPGIRSTADLGDLAPYLRAMRRKYPDHAMAITEFGAEATFAGPATVKETFEFQSEYVSKVLDIVDRHDWLAGALYWTVREFYVKPDWDGGARRANVLRDALHNKGLIHYDGTPKPAWQVTRDRFARMSPLR